MVKLSKKETLIKHFLDIKIKGKRLTHSEIAKISKLNRGLVYYYDKKRPETLYEKSRSKLPPKYINYIYREASNKKLSEVNGRVLAEKVNNKLKKDGVKKNGKHVTISISQINRILKKNSEKQEKLEKFFI